MQIRAVGLHGGSVEQAGTTILDGYLKLVMIDVTIFC